MGVVIREFAKKTSGNFTCGIMKVDNSFYPVKNGAVQINPGDHYRVMIMFNGTGQWASCYAYDVTIDGKHVISGGLKPFERDTYDIYEGPQNGRTERFTASNSQSLLNGISSNDLGKIKISFYSMNPVVKSVSKGFASRGLGTTLSGQIENEVQAGDYTEFTMGELITNIEFSLNPVMVEKAL